MQGGIGIELWTMTEDILFDNIYVGHSAEDAKRLAAETFEIKKPLEVAADKPLAADDDEEEKISFNEDPVSFLRNRVLGFIEAARASPLEAFKSQPETGAVLVFALLTLVGMFSALVNIIAGAQKPVVTKVGFFIFLLVFELIVTSMQSTKKTDAVTPDDKTKTEAAPVSAAGEKKDDSTVKKRKQDG